MVAHIVPAPQQSNNADTGEHVAYAGWSFRRAGPGGSKEIGTTGLITYGGDVGDEWHHALRGGAGVRVYREMNDNDSSIGASFHLIDSQVRQVRWFAEPAKDHAMAEEAAEFLTGVMGDMSHSWVDFLSEGFTMLPFGWSMFEKVYKYRDGKKGDSKSKFSDGRVGIRKLAPRAQETLDGWEFDEAGGLVGMWQNAAPHYRRVLIPIEKALLLRPKATKGNPEGRSLLRPAYRPWYFLKRLEELEAIGIERDLVGLPKMELPKEYFDENASAAKRAAVAVYAKLGSQVRRNQHESLTLPCEEGPDGKKTGFRFSLVTTGGQRALDIGGALTRHRQSVGQVLLTQFIFLGMDKVGTQALSNSLTTLFSTSLAVLLDIVEETFARYVVAELMELNGYPEESWPRWKHGDVEKADIRPLAEALLGLVNAGVLTPDSSLEDYIRNEARLPKRDEEEEKDGDEPAPGGLPRGGDDATQKDAASAVVGLVAAIDKLARIGDVDLCNAARNALAMLLGIENPAPLTDDDLAELTKPPPGLDGGGADGQTPKPGKKPGKVPGDAPKDKPRKRGDPRL